MSAKQSYSKIVPDPDLVASQPTVEPEVRPVSGWTSIKALLFAILLVLCVLSVQGLTISRTLQDLQRTLKQTQQTRLEVPFTLSPVATESKTPSLSASSALAVSASPSLLAPPADITPQPFSSSSSTTASQSPVPSPTPSLSGAPPPKPTGTPMRAFVISLPKDADRRNEFAVEWKKVLPNMDITVVEGIMHPTRGKGLGVAFINAFNKALTHPDELIFFFEDDARPFPGVDYQKDLPNVLSHFPQGDNVLLLGGHHLVFIGPRKNPSGISRLDKSFGTFGFVLRRNTIPKLRDHWQRYIDTPMKAYSIDAYWGRPSYITLPLFVDHKSGTWSNTWNRSRVDSWMGKREKKKSLDTV